MRALTCLLRVLAAAPSAFMSAGSLVASAGVRAAPPGVSAGASPVREIAGDAESKPEKRSAGLEARPALPYSAAEPDSGRG